jgi:hypothetical protein
MNAYLKDLRLKVLSAIDRGMPRREAQTSLESTSLPSGAGSREDALQGMRTQQE